MFETILAYSPLVIIILMVAAAFVWALTPSEYPEQSSREESLRRFRESGPDYGEHQ
jgi:hypothetical protein